jgi:DNA invertase Pin-like site-specific DNA recombinase
MNTEQLEAVVLAVDHKLDEILLKLNAPAKQPGLTVTEFAKRAGVGRTTVHRWYNEGKIRKQNGRIPYECLAKLLS